MSLSPGQELVLRDYLKDFVAHDEYEPTRDTLMTSIDIAFELEEMCEYDKNDISDYMAANGYTYTRFRGSSMHGWILERVIEELELE